MATKQQIGRASQRAELQLCKRLEKLEVEFLEHIERMELQPLDWVQPVGITQLTLRRRAGARQQKNRLGERPGARSSSCLEATPWHTFNYGLPCQS